MGLASTSTNLFNARTVGEALQVSSAYGEYDNGANVFPFYDSFAGTTLDTNLWNQYESNSIQGSLAGMTINNGLVLTPAAGLYPNASWIDSTISSAQFNGPKILDALTAAWANTIYNGRVMFEDTFLSNFDQGNGFGFQSPSDSS